MAGTTLPSEAIPLPTTPEKPAVPKPADDVVPTWIGWLDGTFVLIVLGSAALILSSNWAVSTPAELRRTWGDQVTRELRDPQSPSRIDRGDALPTTGDAVFFVDSREDSEVAASFLSAIDFRPEGRRVVPTDEITVEPIPTASSFVVEIVHGWLGSRIRVWCFRSRPRAEPLQYSERASFRFKDDVARINGWAAPLILLIAACARGIRIFVIGQYRARRLDEWREYEAARTTKIYEAKQHLEAARAHSTANEVAKALVELRRALEKLPDYAEARALYNLLVHSQAIDAAAITSMTDAVPSGRSGTTLYLRVAGTPYAYRADVSADVIRIGRQRRQPNEQDGNDLVIRVPASDERTLRISRHHLEINRIDKDYFVIDRSDGRTQLNGRFLTTGTPVQITSGDRLTIARVLTLEVSIRGIAAAGDGARMIDAESDNGRFKFEATVGDMLTEVGR
jgi:hypothetical protein